MSKTRDLHDKKLSDLIGDITSIHVAKGHRSYAALPEKVKSKVSSTAKSKGDAIAEERSKAEKTKSK